MNPVDYSKAFYKKNMPLNPIEQKLHDSLLTVSSESFWGIAIRDSFIDYTDTKFRELVCELLSQMHDSPDVMYRILGKEAYDLLNELKPKI